MAGMGAASRFFLIKARYGFLNNAVVRLLWFYNGDDGDNAQIKTGRSSCTGECGREK
jgi:hypothetical protein